MAKDDPTQKAAMLAYLGFGCAWPTWAQKQASWMQKMQLLLETVQRFPGSSPKPITVQTRHRPLVFV